MLHLHPKQTKEKYKFSVFSILFSVFTTVHNHNPIKSKFRSETKVSMRLENVADVVPFLIRLK